jgi:glycosyltransferase involved in cell wall biosynthesis
MSVAGFPPSGWSGAQAGVPRILHIFSTFEVGGSQRRFAALANHFGRGFQHLIWPMDGRAEAVALLEDTVQRDVVNQPFPKGQFLGNALKARKLIKLLGPDVMVTYNWGAIEWAAGNITGLVRHIHIEDGFGPEEAVHQLPRRVLFRRLILNRNSTVVLPSQRLVTLATDVWRIDPKRVMYIPNGIPCSRFSGPPDRQFVEAFQGRGPIIGTIATLRREKALGRLIQAFATLRAARLCHLVIAGDGPERRGLEQTVAAAGLRQDVTFTGYIDRPEKIVGAFDIFAMSSDTEQMPLGILEAMAAARPIVSTDAGDIRAMVSDDNRAFIVPISTEALSSALSAMLDDRALMTRLGHENQTKARADFDELGMLARYGQLFSEGESAP